MKIEKMEQIIILFKKYNLQKMCVEIDDFKLEIYDYQNTTEIEKNIKLNYEDNAPDKLALNIVNESNTDEDENVYVIKAPLVGNINILNNEITGKKYSVGDKISKGTAICTIEAMKMFNEVSCIEDGVIEDIFMDDNQFVEYNQPLFKIKK